MSTLDAALLGTDLLVPPDPDGALLITASGDLALVAGRPNLHAALRRRMGSAAGEMTHRPEYGAGITAFVELPTTPGNLARAGSQIRRNLLRDPRLSEVTVAISRGLPGETTPTEHAVTVGLTIRARHADLDETLTASFAT